VGQEPGPPVFFPISSSQISNEGIAASTAAGTKNSGAVHVRPRALDSAGSFEVTSTGGVVILPGGTTVTGDVNIRGTATGSGAKLPQQVCGAIVNGNLTVQSVSNVITVGGTNCGATAVGGNLQVGSGSGAVSITCTSITGTLEEIEKGREASSRRTFDMPETSLS